MQSVIRLNTGAEMPQVGLGTWRAFGDEVKKAVNYALIEAGYKHIDCAHIYENEKEIGEVFGSVFSGSLKREEVFITSKLWNDSHKKADVRKACEKTLQDLQLDYLDLYLVHWGFTITDDDVRGSGEHPHSEEVPMSETWQAMEELVEIGLVKAIGMANFTCPMIIDLLSYSKIKPAVNQIEIHPLNTQERLVEFCKAKNIAVTAYSPLGRPGYYEKDEVPSLVENKLILELAKKYNKTPAQILLRWSIDRGLIAIPKSITLSRIKENIEVFDFELKSDEVEKINKLDRKYRFVDPYDWWKIPYFE